MADILNIFAALEKDDCETISCAILDSKEDTILPATVACFMQKKLRPCLQGGRVTLASGLP